MRTLVEQTLQAVDALRESSELDFDVVPCMGGLVDKEYALRPDRPTVLVGTQDMLVSRMLNRGYAAARGRWPVDFGLLTRDVLVVCDEIQLMGASLPTTAQLAAFQRRRVGFRPCHTWWMSATLQPDWMRTVDLAPHVAGLEEDCAQIPEADQRGGIWDNDKSLQLRPELADPKGIATAVSEAHEEGTLTLVIVNRVRTAVDVHKALGKSSADVRLVHSRFRPAERRGWLADFLSRSATIPPAGRIIVATQVVEAGVDVSAKRLFTELAPWPSLVQRFGRAGRYLGEQAEIVVMGAADDSPKKTAPYTPEELVGAQQALRALVDAESGVALRELEAFERRLDPERRAALYPQVETAVLRERDLLDLFDTTADLSGADLDVAPFVRDGDERDVTLFWRELEDDEELGNTDFPAREELCRCPIADARKWLAKTHLKGKWSILDFSDGWRRGTASELRSLAPGRIVRVSPEAGGYQPDLGLDLSSKRRVDPWVPDAGRRASDAFEVAAAVESSEALSVSPWRTIRTHCWEAAEEAGGVGTALGLAPQILRLVELAARWHDVGKAHPVFQRCIREDARETLSDPARPDLAKAPRGSWTRSARRGFRHELASMLAMLDVVRRAAPDHPGLRGSVQELLDALGVEQNAEAPDLQGHPVSEELCGLTADELDLVLWLVVTHHGKVRGSLVSTPNDQRDMRREGKTQVHGVRQGDTLPSITMAGPTGPVELPATRLDLAVSQVGVDAVFGRSWTERAERLLAEHGPFDLAWLEAILRAADARASQRTTPEPGVAP
jgi:CRISPR-associated endonuclease/helicase Cas3